MADQTHVQLVRRGPRAIDGWRDEHLYEHLDLSGADFSGLDLSGVVLCQATMTDCRFVGTRPGQCRFFEFASRWSESGACLAPVR